MKARAYYLIMMGLSGWVALLFAFANKEPIKELIKTVYVEKEVPVEKIVLSSDVHIHEVIGTIYNPVEEQCDSDPLTTADNSKINLDKLKNKEIRWCALSRDLLKRWGGPYNYGDTLTVFSSNSKVRGLWIVHDTMNRRFKKRIDFLVDVSENKKFPHKTKHILISNTPYYIKR